MIVRYPSSSKILLFVGFLLCCSCHNVAMSAAAVRSLPSSSTTSSQHVVRMQTTARRKRRRQNNKTAIMMPPPQQQEGTSQGEQPQRIKNNIHRDPRSSSLVPSFLRSSLLLSSSASCNIKNWSHNMSRGGGKTTSSAAGMVTNNNNNNNTPFVEGIKNSIASGLAAGLSKTLLAPLDTIKTLQQFHQQTSAAGAAGTKSSLSILQAAKQIASRPNGVWNFYSGLGVSVVGAMPSVALYFGTYSYFKKSLCHVSWLPGYDVQEKTNKNKTVIVALSAALGNTIASFSRVPYEVLKQKLQTNAYDSTFAALRDINSITDIFPKGGIAIQMMRDIPYAVVTLLIYEHLQQSYHNRYMTTKTKEENTHTNGLNKKSAADSLMGAIAGGTGSFVTNPLDVIKTRIQTAPLHVYDGSVWKCTKLTFADGGISTFLRGSFPRVMHKVPANGCFFLFYEFFRRILKCNQL